MARKSCATWFALVVLSLCGACSSEVSSSTAELKRGVCEHRFESTAVRVGAHGVARLLYRCEGKDCTGAEHFLRGTAHAISVEVDGTPDSSLTLESSNEALLSVSDVASAYDPCAQRMRAWAVLHANDAGEATLTVRDAHGELDSVQVTVAEVSLWKLRASTLTSFAFAAPGKMFVAHVGERLIVLPEPYDQSGTLLVGSLPLTWQVDDPRIAEVRTEPVDDDEAYVREHGAPGGAFIETTSVGQTLLRVRADNGAQGTLPLRVVADE